MKSIFKLTLAMAALLLVSATNAASAQKFGYISFAELVFAMPDVKDVDENLQKLQQEFTDQLEQMQVELNKKMDEYQKTSETMTASIRQLKEQEMDNLNQRMREFYSKAMEDLEAERNKLMEPVIAKARAAVDSVMKAQGLAGVFDSQAMVSMDTSMMTDVMPLVKQQLGIQ